MLRPASLALFAMCLGGLHAHPYAQTRPLTLAWDATAEPGVAGYIVYVGKASGSYIEQYDVGNKTSFEYTRAMGGQPYFFAVAAYGPNGEVGPRSEEIFFLAGTGTAGVSAAIAPARAVASTATASTDAGALCAGTAETSCYRVDRLASLPGEIGALTPTGDGRLLFIDEGSGHVRLIAGDTLMPEPALTASGAQLARIVVDPAFERNRFVYVSEIETRADGRRDLSIVRYRELAGRLGEGASIVSNIPLPSRGDAPFTMDGTRRLYIAVPGSSVAESPYAGTVLRFEADGSVPHESRAGSPIFGSGYADPTSLAWSRAGNQLWLAGSDGPWEAPLASMPVFGDSPQWPRMPEAVALDGDVLIRSLSSTGGSARGSTAAFADDSGVFVVDDEGRSLKIDPNTRRIAATALPSIDVLGGDPIEVVADGGDTYLVVRPHGSGAVISHILRVRQN